MGSIDRKAMIAPSQSQVQVNWLGALGIAHWFRVRSDGLVLVRESEATMYQTHNAPGSWERKFRVSKGGQNVR
jgi:hypothetical protein